MILIYNKSKENYNAGPKAPRDIAKILQNNFNCEEKTFNCIEYKNKLLNKIFNNFKRNIFIKSLKKRESFYVVQMPFSRSNTFKNFLSKNQVVLFIHDLVGIRTQNKKIEKKEILIYKKAKYIIVHNNTMKKYLIQNGINENQIIELELFDYICSDEVKNDEQKNTNNNSDAIVYAGNLAKNKSVFLYNIDINNINFNMNLYGVGLDKDISEKFVYKGKALPEELPNILCGKVGLVWDGQCDNRDENEPVKNYTKYNNPHKMSCYIAAGLPVVVWSKSAIAKFVDKYNIGYKIDTIYDINNLDFSKYEEKLENVRALSKQVREGEFAKRAIEKVINRMENDNEI